MTTFWKIYWASCILSIGFCLGGCIEHESTKTKLLNYKKCQQATDQNNYCKKYLPDYLRELK